MAKTFEMDDKELKRLRKFYKKDGPNAARAAAAFTLTGFAMGTNRQAREIIHQRLRIRNPKFIDNNLKVIFARPNKKINQMKSETGSTRRARYSGLREQQMGESPPGPRGARGFTRAARDGVKTRQVKGWARLKPNAKYPSPNQPGEAGKTRDGRDFGLQGLSGAKRIVAFLMILNEKKKDQTFILRRNFGRFKRGLYRFSKGVVKKLQSFDITGKPKRVKWLTKGMDNYFKSIKVDKVWGANLKREIKKRV